MATNKQTTDLGVALAQAVNDSEPLAGEALADAFRVAFILLGERTWQLETGGIRFARMSRAEVNVPPAINGQEYA